MSVRAQVFPPDAVNETPHRPVRRNGGSTGVSGKERRKPKPPLDAAALRKGLTESRGSYRQVTQLFNMDPSDYKRFLNFLRKHDCQLPYRDFR